MQRVRRLRIRSVTAGLITVLGVAGLSGPVRAQEPIRVPCDVPRLIAAINRANAEPAVLLLAPNCVYRLTAVAATTTNGPDGLPVITGDVTISGGPSTQIRRSDNAPRFRIFEVAGGGTLDLRGIFILGGDSGNRPGGGILNLGRIEARHITVADNRASGAVSGGAGGGIANLVGGRADIVSSLVNGNAAGDGGGIVNEARMQLVDSRITGNAADDRGGGIANRLNGNLSTVRSTIDRNRAGTLGGGLFNAANATLNRTSVVVNQATDGGGIYSAQGRVTLQTSLVRDNSPNNCRPRDAVPGCVN